MITPPLKTLMMAGLLAGLLPLQASGQSLDYGALETLFGEPVTLSATGKPQRASEVPATMEIITAEQIRRSAATDIPGILRRLAGMDVYRVSSTGSDVSIRGYTIPMNGRILVLIDGRQIYNDSFGFISWGLLPVELDEIRQIEVVKGPQSALYGFNAAAGVINIITFDPLDSPTNSVRLRGGTQQNRQVSAVATARASDRFAVRLSAGGEDAAESGKLDERGVPPPTIDPRRRSFHSDAQVRFDDGSRLGFEAGLVSGRERRLNWGFFTTDMFEQIGTLKTSYSAETPLGLITAQAYHNQFHTQADIRDLGGTSAADNGVTVASLQDLFKIGSNNSVRLAAEFRRNESSVFGNPKGNVHYDVWSGSGMWDSALTETVSLVNALRLDHLQLGRSGPINPAEPLTNADFNRTIDALSFNSGLVWRIDEQNTSRLTAGRGLNLPSLSNFGALDLLLERSTGLFLLDYGSPSLQPSVVWNYELSWDHSLPALDASTRASVFYQTTDGLIDYAQNVTFTGFLPPQMLLNTVNYGNSRTAGLELGISGKVAPAWSWAANYTLQTIWDDLPLRTQYFPGVSYANRTPRHKINGRLGYTNGPWEVDLDLYYLSGYSIPDFTVQAPTYNGQQGSFGDFVMLEPRLGYHLNETFTAEVSAQGLWRRQELPLGVVDPSVLFSLVGRW